MTRSKPTIEIYRGWREIAVSDEHLAVFCEGKDPISLEDKMEGDILGEFQDLNPNEYILLNPDSEKEVIVKATYNPENQSECLLSRISPKGTNLKARNPRQEMLLDALRDEDIPLVFALGYAGTGKTFLGIGAGIQQITKKHYDKILIGRPVIFNGENLGALPGSEEEKLKPWLLPIYDNIESLKRIKVKAAKKDEEKIEVQDLAKLQGRNLANSYVLIDEAQNTSPQQAEMQATRVGEGSKLVMTGDPYQVDPSLQNRMGLNTTNNGLVYLSNGLQESIYTATIKLRKEDVERSDLVRDIIRLLHEKD
ncbi:AAA family ATPase [Candidatus Woesearchaeota archaeon]|jgi:predicted ribonuclease YlaK|nr:AAA family ATPase [Candidatus Woesearchaeota archaeon]MBT7238220.1 AAA family ATPase [Candidatus Woesearchaeota archaeon]